MRQRCLSVVVHNGLDEREWRQDMARAAHICTFLLSVYGLAPHDAPMEFRSREQGQKSDAAHTNAVVDRSSQLLYMLRRQKSEGSKSAAGSTKEKST